MNSMARVTTEDCIDKVPNRFDLVMLAAFRARELSSGRADATVKLDNDKNPVIALREIGDEMQLAEDLRERAIASYQTENEDDRPEDYDLDIRPNAVGKITGFDEQPGLSEADILRRLMQAKKSDGQF